jgi:ANTAR domain-containing protein/GAF domain-containing protein
MTEDGRTRENAVRDLRLSATFVALADTLVADYDIVDFLDFLVASCVDLFDVTAAGILLRDARGNLRPVASSNEETRLLELFQLQNDEGPCLDSIHTGIMVSAPDLTLEHDRWPRFAPAALEVGFRSVQALPMRLRTDTIGGLNLFSSGQPPLAGSERDLAQALADVTTVDSRISIEQAKGVLAASGGVDMATAFDSLRRYARGSNQKLSSVAADLAQRRLDPRQVLAVSPRARHRPTP